ncbi:25823_t:CDS:1, partial [Racocetra persica]
MTNHLVSSLNSVIEDFDANDINFLINNKDIYLEEESYTDIEIEECWKRKITVYEYSFNKWHLAIKRRNQYEDDRYEFTEDR